MSLIVRESDVDLDVMRARVTPQHMDDALECVQNALRALQGLETYKGEGEGTHETIRALYVVRDAIKDALDE